MIKGKRILALIPARSGSKKLPGKNIKPMNGRPLIAWTIEEAKKSRYIDRIIVSTDNEKIKRVSKKYGADAPFLRPKELATDEAKVIDVVIYTINWLKQNGESFDLLILLQPTSPLRTAEDIDKAVELLFLKDAKNIVSVCECNYHPYWSNTIPKDGCMKDFIRPDVINKNRQDLPKYYRSNGAIYLAYCDYIRRQEGFFGDETFAYIMPEEHSIDIDSKIDFKLAEILVRDLCYRK